jgi:hypothetical protein
MSSLSVLSFFSTRKNAAPLCEAPSENTDLDELEKISDRSVCNARDGRSESNLPARPLPTTADKLGWKCEALKELVRSLCLLFVEYDIYHLTRKCEEVLSTRGPVQVHSRDKNISPRGLRVVGDSTNLHVWKGCVASSKDSTFFLDPFCQDHEIHDSIALGLTPL